MLTETDGDEYDRIAHVMIMNEGDTSTFSLQSGDFGSNSDVIHCGGVKTKLGLLILEGEETYGDKHVGDGEDDCHFEMKHHVNKLSIPDTALLPSDMRSIVTPGAVPQELSTSRVVFVHECGKSMMSDSYRQSNTFSRIIVMRMMMVFFAAILSFGAMRNNLEK